MKHVNLPAEAVDFLLARPHLPAHPTDRLQKVGPDIAMFSARDYLQRNNLQATDEQLRAALRPHLEAVWAGALAPATSALENNPTWCRIPTNPVWGKVLMESPQPTPGIHDDQESRGQRTQEGTGDPPRFEFRVTILDEKPSKPLATQPSLTDDRLHDSTALELPEGRENA